MDKHKRPSADYGHEWSVSSRFMTVWLMRGFNRQVLAGMQENGDDCNSSKMPGKLCRRTERDVFLIGIDRVTGFDLSRFGMLFRLSFYAFIGLLALPSLAPEGMRGDTQPVASVAADGTSYDADTSLIALGTGLVQDVTGLCARQPAICVQGARLADAAVVRAEHGLRIAYKMVINHRDTKAEAGAPS
jgi:hypothetical protein